MDLGFLFTIEIPISTYLRLVYNNRKVIKLYYLLSNSVLHSYTWGTFSQLTYCLIQL